MNKNLHKIILALMLLIPFPTLAAGTISVTPSTASVVPGEEFMMTVKFDTGDATINAISATIDADPEISLRAIFDGSSIVPIWIEKPSIMNKKITFAGIIPGGLYGSGEILRFTAAASTTGTFKVSVSDTQALSQGQEPKPINIKILSAKVVAKGKMLLSTIGYDDQISPENLTASIERNDQLYDGAAVAVFSADDKQSGIDNYEVAFSYLKTPGEDSWVKASSPYVIPGEANGKLIWIRAIDRGGNKTTIHIAGPNYYRNTTILAILMVILICLAHFARRSMSSRRLP